MRAQLDLMLARLVAVGCYGVPAFLQIQDVFPELPAGTGFRQEMGKRVQANLATVIVDSRLMVRRCHCFKR